jgi:bifunctional ADP-heptose synthase (sugar kinase/adenylyltransferase)
MTTAEIIGALPQLSALVVGDTCLDRWCRYDPAEAELSRETGIPRTAVISVEVTPGAGGTVANNLAALGVGRAAVLGAFGDDGHGAELARALGERGISSDLCVRSAHIQTFTYTKLINQATGIEDQPRIDFINRAPVPMEIERQILDRLREAIGIFDVVLISDQAETSHGGVVTAAVRELLANLALKYPEKIFWADSRARIAQFRNVILKPNQHEARAACNGDYSAWRRHAGAPVLMVTHGGAGVRVVDDAGDRWVETKAVANPVDICGAGDSFSAGAATALHITRSPDLAARFGNLVASITIMKPGTGTAAAEEVLGAEDAW